MNKLTLLLGVLGILAVSCTEDKEIKEVEKDSTILSLSKSSLNLDGEFLYVPVYGEANRRVDQAMPQYQGKEKIVRLEMKKNSLEVLGVEKDERFQSNPLNDSPVLSIPATHKDYECVKDDYDRCTNSEKEDISKPWNERRYVDLNLDSMSVLDTNVLPIQLAGLFEGCYTKIGTEIVNKEFSKDAIIITAEETYSTNIRCVGSLTLEDLSSLTFRMRVHYNMVRLDTMASNENSAETKYEELYYGREEQGFFGFFDTETDQLDVDFGSTLDRKKVVANRWNPKRSKIIYHLNDEFSKPKNKGILEATKYAVNVLNDGLKKSGAKFQIDLQMPSGKSEADIRNSMIVIVDNPTNGGILGYGPIVVNPQSGEILSARTNMYRGNIIRSIARDYDAVVLKKMEDARQKELLAQVGEVDTIKINGVEIRNPLVSGSKPKSKESSISESEKETLKAGIALLKPQVDSTVRASNLSNVKGELASIKMENRMIQRNHLSADDHLTFDHINYMELSSENNALHEDVVNIEEAVRLGLEKLLPGVEDLKPWLALTDEEQEKILDIVMPLVWIPTLVHEMGHNLGLRHNFNGSEDKDNFYSKEELLVMGVDRPIHYSSVMEYGFNSLDSLPILGKYDIAAFKYAYAGKVELTDGKDVSLVNADGTRKLVSSMEKLKPFRYCTDEHVSANANCNRFDQGTNSVEITQFLADRYEFFYNYRNKRNKRVNFSKSSDPAYYSARRSEFEAMRLFYENYDRIRNIPFLQGYTWEAGQYPPNTSDEDKEFLKELNQSVVNVGQFFIDVLLKPDITCAVYQLPKTDPEGNEVPGQAFVMPAASIDPNAESCFDIQLNPEYEMIGQGGRAFESTRSKFSSYADQIDTRGIWADKLAATEFLFKENLGSDTFDEIRSNFVTHPVLGVKVLSAVSSILFDEVQTEVKLKIIDGSEVKVPYAFTPSDSFEIQSRLGPMYDKVMGLSNGPTPFAREMLKVIRRSINDNSNLAQKRLKLAMFDVKMGDCERGDLQASVMGETFCASEYNQIAAIAINRVNAKKNLDAIGEQAAAMILKQKIALIAKVDMEKASRIIASAATEALRNFLILDLLNTDTSSLEVKPLSRAELAALTPVERSIREVKQLPEDGIMMYFNGMIQSEEFHYNLLLMLTGYNF